MKKRIPCDTSSPNPNCDTTFNLLMVAFSHGLKPSFYLLSVSVVRANLTWP